MRASIDTRWCSTLEDARARRARLLQVEQRRLGVMVARSARIDAPPRMY